MDAMKAALEKKMMEMKMKGHGDPEAQDAIGEDLHDSESLDGTEKAPDLPGTDPLKAKIAAAGMGSALDSEGPSDDDHMEILKALSGGDSPMGRSSHSLSEKVGEKAKAAIAMHGKGKKV